jgi:PPOX class probable F420-dependent enzyme
MSVTLPETAKKVLEDKAYGHVITFGKDGRPQITMVWMDVDNGKPSFNTAEGRVKPRNLRRDPRIIVSVQNRQDPQSFITVEGTATLTHDGADAQIDKLAKRFLGHDTYPFRQPGEQRVKVQIDVARIGGLAPGMKPWS